MPTYGRTDTFISDFNKLTREQRDAFLRVLPDFIDDVNERSFRHSLRIRGVQGAPGVFEMTWAQDGRATFQYGQEIIAGEPHVIWRRVGTHSVFNRP